MADWATRLAVSYQDETGASHLITPIDAVTQTIATNAEVIHSIERSHAGIIYTPQGMTFTLTVKSIGDVAADLTAISLEGKRFSIIVQERDGEHADWGFKNLVLSECLITSVAHSANPSGAPSATFSGVSLGASAEPKSSAKVSIP